MYSLHVNILVGYCNKILFSFLYTFQKSHHKVFKIVHLPILEDDLVITPGSISPSVRQTTEKTSTTTILSDEASDSSTLSPRPTIRPKPSGCTQKGVFYADGSSMETENPCEHCYCIQGKMVWRA